VPRDLGHPAISNEGWRVSIDPQLGSLTQPELLEIIERQANAIRILQNKASQRESLLDDLRRRLTDPSE
jgi:hypothetical protein